MKSRLEEKLAATVREAKRKEKTTAKPSKPAIRKKAGDSKSGPIPTRRVWPD